MDNKIEIVKEIIKGMNKQGKMYWLGIMIKQGYISKVEAGFILTYNIGVKL